MARLTKDMVSHLFSAFNMIVPFEIHRFYQPGRSNMNSRLAA
jgi:hypothetical protein